MELVLAPLAVIAPAIWPDICPAAVNLALLPLTLVHSLVGPPVQAVAILTAPSELAFK